MERFGKYTQDGFTFIEVMASIVVISIMALTAASVVKSTNDELINIKSSRYAYELAQQKLYQLVVSEDLSSYMGSSGTFDSKESEDYTWTSEVIGSAYPELRVLVIHVDNEELKIRASLNYIIYSNQ